MSHHETVPFILREAANVFEQRAQEYGDVTKSFDNITAQFLALSGIDLTEVEAAKFLMALKLARLMENDRHEDSYLDLAVYSCIALAFVRRRIRLEATENV